MNVLALHNRYLLPGGEDLCIEAEILNLRSKGHFVEEYILDNKIIEDIGEFRTALRSIWSTESYTQLTSVLKSKHFDLALVQNYFPLLSPSIFYASQNNNVPIIQLLDNYRISCVNGMFFRDNHICEDCLGKKFPFPGVRHRCYKGSTFGSLAVGTMLFTHQLMNTWQKRVDGFISHTKFAKELFIKAGLPEHKLYLRPNFLFQDPGMKESDYQDFIFVGRLSKEKGVEDLIQSGQLINKNIKIKVIGSGPMESLFRNEVLNNFEYLGQQPNSVTIESIKKSGCLIFPSIWLEGMPRTILESFACGTPVIASNIGAMHEMIEHGKTGLLFRAGDPNDLAEKINWASEHPSEMTIMGKNARKEFEAKNNAEKAYDSLMDIYEQISISRKTSVER